MVKLSFVTLVLVMFFGFVRCAPEPIGEEEVLELYRTPLSPPQEPLSIYHIGHSLVSRDMPAMVAQLAGDGHKYESQLGWGTTLRAHWEPDIPINGHGDENSHARYREAHDAVNSGDYDVLVLTEMVEIRDSIKYHESWEYLARWAAAARASRPSVRIYVYETWPRTDSSEGFLNRIDKDLRRYWEREIIDRAISDNKEKQPIYVIPAGQVIARFLREVDARSGVEGISGIEDLFVDKIHYNDIGAYLVALTHYSVIYGRSPIGLPYKLKLHTGDSAVAPSHEAAKLMQAIVWDVVTGYPRTGVRQTPN